MRGAKGRGQAGQSPPFPLRRRQMCAQKPVERVLESSFEWDWLVVVVVRTAGSSSYLWWWRACHEHMETGREASQLSTTTRSLSSNPERRQLTQWPRSCNNISRPLDPLDPLRSVTRKARSAQSICSETCYRDKVLRVFHAIRCRTLYYWNRNATFAVGWESELLSNVLIKNKKNVASACKLISISDMRIYTGY